MKKKLIFSFAVVVVLSVGGYFLLRNPKDSEPDSDLILQENSQKVPTQETPSTSSTEDEKQVINNKTSSVDNNLVTYKSEGYSPSTLRVKKGTTVTFKNNSSQSMWTASDIHPTHTLYPTIGGCLGSTFDSCKGIQSNNSWSFKFNSTGTWKYHNHLNPADTGNIIVE